MQAIHNRIFGNKATQRINSNVELHRTICQIASRTTHLKRQIVAYSSAVTCVPSLQLPLPDTWRWVSQSRWRLPDDRWYTAQTNQRSQPLIHQAADSFIPHVAAPGKKPPPATHAGRYYWHDLVAASCPSLGSYWDKLLGFAGLKHTLRSSVRASSAYFCKLCLVRASFEVKGFKRATGKNKQTNNFSDYVDVLWAWLQHLWRSNQTSSTRASAEPHTSRCISHQQLRGRTSILPLCSQNLPFVCLTDPNIFTSCPAFPRQSTNKTL